MTPEVWILDRHLSRVGLVDEVIDLDAKPRWRSVGGWQLVAKGGAADALREPGAGIEIRLAGHTIFTGPASHPAWGPTGTVTVDGVDDLVWLARRRVLTGASSPYPLTVALTDEAETSIRTLVDGQLGPSADAPRRAVTLEPDQARGQTGDWEANLGQPVLDVAIKIAASQGWGLEIRRQADATRLFRILVPRDRTRTVRLHEDKESIADYRRLRQAPDATHVYVGGEVDRDEDERAVIDAGVDSPWGRIETFEDARSADSTDELAQVAADTLADGAAVDAVTAETAPIDEFTFPADYRLGDVVSVKVDGARQPTLATVVGLDITETDVRPVLSDGRWVEERPTVSAIKELRRRMARSETQ